MKPIRSFKQRPFSMGGSRRAATGGSLSAWRKGPAALLIAMTTGVLPAAAMAQVACGDTLTADTTLTANLVCPGDGLILDSSAGPVTLDLNGFVLRNSNADPTGAGVTLLDSAEPYEIRNGIIRGFDVGVQGATTLSRGVTLAGVRVIGNRVGGEFIIENYSFLTPGYVGLTVSDSLFVNNQYGLRVNSSPAFSGFANFDRRGQILITGSRFNRNAIGLELRYVAGGIHQARFFDNLGIGANMIGTAGLSVSRSVFRRNYYGAITDSTGYGDHWASNQFTDNRIGMSHECVGVEFGADLYFDEPEKSATSYSNNLFARNAVYGFVAQRTSAEGLTCGGLAIVDNRAYDNGIENPSYPENVTPDVYGAIGILVRLGASPYAEYEAKGFENDYRTADWPEPVITGNRVQGNVGIGLQVLIDPSIDPSKAASPVIGANDDLGSTPIGTCDAGAITCVGGL